MYIRITQEYDTPAINRKKSLQYEPSIFSRHVLPLKEQRIAYKKRSWFINAKGFRGGSFSQRKESGKIRIMVYGGSAVFDQNISDQRDWPHQIEFILKEKGLGNIEVINAGIPGHATFDSVGRLFAEGHVFEPDFVILYNAWNDIKYFSFEQPILRKFQPYDVFREFRSQYQSTFDQILCEWSQLYVRLRNLVLHLEVQHRKGRGYPRR